MKHIKRFNESENTYGFIMDPFDKSLNGVLEYIKRHLEDNELLNIVHLNFLKKY